MWQNIKRVLYVIRNSFAKRTSKEVLEAPSTHSALWGQNLPFSHSRPLCVCLLNESMSLCSFLLPVFIREIPFILQDPFQTQLWIQKWFSVEMNGAHVCVFQPSASSWRQGPGPVPTCISGMLSHSAGNTLQSERAFEIPCETHLEWMCRTTPCWWLDLSVWWLLQRGDTKPSVQGHDEE